MLDVGMVWSALACPGSKYFSSPDLSPCSFFCCHGAKKNGQFVMPVSPSLRVYNYYTEIKAPSTENPKLLKILCLKPAEGQNIALHVWPTVRNCVFLISAYSVHSVSFFPDYLLT